MCVRKLYCHNRHGVDYRCFVGNSLMRVCKASPFSGEWRLRSKRRYLIGNIFAFHGSLDQSIHPDIPRYMRVAVTCKDLLPPIHVKHCGSVAATPRPTQPRHQSRNLPTENIAFQNTSVTSETSANMVITPVYHSLPLPMPQ